MKLNKVNGGTVAVVAAILGIVLLVGFAIQQGHNGAILSLGIAVIAALGGVKIRDIFRE